MTCAVRDSRLMNIHEPSLISGPAAPQARPRTPVGGCRRPRYRLLAEESRWVSLAGWDRLVVRDEVAQGLWGSPCLPHRVRRPSASLPGLSAGRPRRADPTERTSGKLVFCQVG